MKIGLLTYHAVCNFGANIQALSTISFFQNNGYDIEIINWRPEDLDRYYEKTVPAPQRKMHDQFLKDYLPTSVILKTNEEVNDYINHTNFDAIIIGSDAVFNYHPILTRLFPSKKTLIKYIKPSADHRFPNPFWGNFSTNGKIIALSACAQALNYRKCLPFERKEIRTSLLNFDYITVRDRWAKKIVETFVPEKSVSITPDPVFGLKTNYPSFDNDDVIERYNLPKKYIVFSFCYNSPFKESWYNTLYDEFNKEGYTVVNLAMPEGCVNLKSDITINTPLPVRDWYNIIRLSSGYIGQRMHPMIVALINNVPIYIFDHYVIRGTNDLNSSKIYDLLERGELLNYYCNISSNKTPSPLTVTQSILNFDKEKESTFIKNYSTKYQELMNNILQRIRD